MKKITLITGLLFIAFTFTSRAQQHVKQYIVHISPTGMGEKQIDELTLELGDAQVQTNTSKIVIFTNENTLRDVIAYIRANNTHEHEPGGTYGSFGIVIFDQVSQLTKYFLPSSQQSTAFFKYLIASLTAKKADQNVIDELQKIQVLIGN